MSSEIENLNQEKEVSAVLKPEAQLYGEGIIEHLVETLGISHTMLAALLGVTERSMTTWKKESVSKLEMNPKSKRLMSFYQVVQIGLNNKVPKKLILNLLQDSIDPEDENSATLLYYIVHEPNNTLVNKIAKTMCTRFIK